MLDGAVRRQPIQIIINKIERDHVHGYVSPPKYRQPELTNVSYSSPANPVPANSGASANSDRQKTQPRRLQLSRRLAHADQLIAKDGTGRPGPGGSLHV